MSTVFMSHSNEDKPFARRLTRDLRRNGHVVWIDEAEIRLGESLTEKIRDGIDRVDFVGAILSQTSVKSEWVKREIDIATNRELKEKRIILLPILVENVKLPAFLAGKKYADFRPGKNYRDGFAEILRTLGAAKPAPRPSEELLGELDSLRRKVAQYERDIARRAGLAAIRRSVTLQKAIDEENASHPEWAHINNAYAFEVMRGIPVTVGYTLHSFHKASVKGSSPLEVALHLEKKQPEFFALAEALEDYFSEEDKELG